MDETKTRISIMVPEELLEKIDKSARAVYQTRSAWIISTLAKNFLNDDKEKDLEQ
jgi:metal-responsive CopG/Arc/MetJ family transcriptional regulator